MSGREPEETVPLPLVHQRWRHVLFLHWAYPPEAVAAVLPGGLQPDLHDGAAWVSITPFLVERARPSLLPPIPRLSTYPETNVRTYVRGPGGVDGLWFLTLEVGSLANALGGRLAVPYRWVDMSVDVVDDEVAYDSHRRAQRSVGHHIRVRPGDPLHDRPPLVDWLTGTWRAWAECGRRLATVPVRHQPWPLQTAELLRLEESLLAAHGLPEPEGAPLVHFSRGVDAHLGSPQLRTGHQ